MRRWLAWQRLGLVTMLSLGASLLGCKVEEILKFAADGSGSYRARIAVEPEFAEILPRLKKQSEQQGLRILEEGKRDGDHFLVVGRDFTSVDKLNDKDDSYKLKVDRQSWLRSSYRLEIVLGSNLAASGFERTLKVEMPVRVIRSSAGTVAAKSVVWDASQGGTLRVEAAGFALPFGGGWLALVLGLVAFVGVGLVAIRLRGPRGQSSCHGCQAPLAAGAKFCPGCGREQTDGTA